MKEYLIPLLFTLLLSGHITKSQTTARTGTHVHLGSQNYVRNNMMPSQIVAHDESGIYVIKVKLSDELRGHKGFPVLERYNNQMELTSFGELQIANPEEAAQFERILQAGNHLYCFYSTTDQSGRSKILLADIIDKSTLSLHQAPKVIQKIPLRRKSRFNNPSFHLKPSEKGNLLLAAFNQPTVKGNHDEFQFLVLDQNMEEIWATTFTSPYKRAHYQTLNLHLTESGNLYMLSKTAPSKKALEKFWEPRYHFSILAITQNGNKIREIKPDIAHKHLTKMQIGTNRAEQLVCAGFYTSLKDGTSPGSYFITLRNGEIIQQNFRSFEPLLFSENSNTSVKISREEKQEGLYAYRLNDIVFRSDGSAVLIAEQATQTADFNPRAHYPSSSIFFNTIAVVNITTEGEVMWTRQIHKNQVASEAYSFFSSYAAAVSNDNVYLVFNDHPENLCKGVCEPVHFSPKGSQKDVLIAIVKLDRNGNIKKEALSFSRDLNILTKPSACKQVAPNQMVVLGQYNKAYRMARLDFEKTFSHP